MKNQTWPSVGARIPTDYFALHRQVKFILNPLCKIRAPHFLSHQDTKIAASCICLFALQPLEQGEKEAGYILYKYFLETETHLMAVFHCAVK